MSNRRFGVEIECLPPENPRYTGGHYGYEYVRDRLKRDGIPVHSVGYDGSGCEVRTRVLQGKAGMDELKAIFDCLNAIGCDVTDEDGQHIHLEGKEFQGSPGRELRVKLVKSYLANREHIMQFVDPDRHSSDMCANAWGGTSSVHVYEDHEWAEPIDGLKEGKWFGAKGYDLNLNNLKAERRGTIEVRTLEGQLSFEKAQAWITLWQDFIDHVAAVSAPLKKYHSMDSMFVMLGLDPELRLRLKKIADGYKKGVS